MKNQPGIHLAISRWILIILLNFFGLFPEIAISQDSPVFINRSPTIDVIANQALCYTKDYQTLLLHGISAGPESNQMVSLKVSTDQPGMFDELEVNQLANKNGYLRFHLQKGRFGTARISITVQDNGGVANGGVDEFKREFSISVFGPPTVTLRSSILPYDPKINLNDHSGGADLPAIQLTASMIPHASYYWYPSNGLSDPTISNPVLKAVLSGPQKLFVNVSNEYGCHLLDSITVNPHVVGNSDMHLSIYPNPARENSMIRFTLAKQQNVSLDVYQVSGKKVANLFLGKVNAHEEYQVGFHTKGLPGGTYIVSLSSISDTKSLKLLVTQ